MHCVLSVDGGNTKTIALVASLDGTILGAGRSGCGDIYHAQPSGGPEASAQTALAHIAEAVHRALNMADAQPADLAAAVFNMAGADWPEDVALLYDAMKASGFGRTILVQNDALAMLHPLIAGEAGVSVICGTGAATGARAPDGRTWHSSFWQDQVQGGAHLGQKTLQAVYRAALGIEPPTSLTERVLAVFGLRSVEEVLHLLSARSKRAASDQLGRLAPLLLDEAAAGDPVAWRIVREHGLALGDYALAAARRVGIEQCAFSLVLAGGLFRHPDSLLADAIVERVRQTSPAVRPLRASLEPAVAVLFRALELAGVTLDDALLGRLISSVPPPSLFATVPI
jgi:N-acetylglucosamine kinase-like BadF-type ATPase